MPPKTMNDSALSESLDTCGIGQFFTKGCATILESIIQSKVLNLAVSLSMSHESLLCVGSM